MTNTIKTDAATSEKPATNRTAGRSTKWRMAREPKAESAAGGAETPPPAKSHGKAATPPAPPAPPSTRGPSKIASVIALLQRPEGATLEQMVAATGWLPHTTRAALTGLKKKGHTITKDKVEGVTRYSIAAAAQS